MNLALLDPFRRQVPDRIDSTLSLPRSLHPARPSSSSPSPTKSSSSSSGAVPPQTTSSSASSPPPSSAKKKKHRKKKSSDGSDEAGSARRTLRDDDDGGGDDASAAGIAGGGGRNSPAGKSTGGGGGASEDAPTAEEWRGCYSVTFNRRGTYLAAGYASGTAAVHDFAGRTLSAAFWPPSSFSSGGETVRRAGPGSSMATDEAGASSSVGGVTTFSGSYGGSVESSSSPAVPANSSQQQRQYLNGVTAISWSRRSRLLLSSAVGDRNIRLVDCTHPLCPEDVSDGGMSGGGGGTGAGSGGGSGGATGEGDDESTKGGGPDGSSGGVGGSADLDLGGQVQLPPAEADAGLVVVDVDEEALAVAAANGTPAKKKKKGPKPLTPEKSARGAKAKGSDSRVEAAEVLARSRLLWDAVVVGPATEDGLRRARMEARRPAKKSPSGSAAKLADERRLAALEKMRRAEETKIAKARAASEAPSSKKKGSKKKASDATKEGENLAAEVPMSPLAPPKRYQTLVLPLPRPVGGPVQIHPHDGLAGMAILDDGSLVLFRFPEEGFQEERLRLTAMSKGGKGKKNEGDKAKKDEGGGGKKAKGGDAGDGIPPWVELVVRKEQRKVGRVMYVVPPPTPQGSSSKGGGYEVASAAFGRRGRVLYVATKCGHLLGFRISPEVLEGLGAEKASASSSSSGSPPSKRQRKSSSSAAALSAANAYAPVDPPAFRVKIPGGAFPWQLIVSRSGRSVMVNSSDCALRLYDASECWTAVGGEDAPSPSALAPSSSGGGIPKKEGFEYASTSSPLVPLKPRFTFQDPVSKVPWVSCDFSGDGEHVVGGRNVNIHMGDGYELFIWSAATGTLVDRLTGPKVNITDLSWHPTRPFVAVGTSDGLVDVWGPRMDWTAFAPDFQALPMNVEYVEREDEFDVVVDGEEMEDAAGEGGGADSAAQGKKPMGEEEEDFVDVVTVERVPVFDSDSEDESDVFFFQTKVKASLKKMGPGGGGGTIGSRALVAPGSKL